MMEFTVRIDDADYDTAIPLLLPLVFRNGAKAKAAMLAVRTRLRGKSDAERNAILIEFINGHKDEIVKKINERLTEYGCFTAISDLSAKLS